MRAGRFLCKCEKDNFDCIMRNKHRSLVINAMISLNLRHRASARLPAALHNYCSIVNVINFQEAQGRFRRESLGRTSLWRVHSQPLPVVDTVDCVSMACCGKSRDLHSLDRSGPFK